MQGGLGILDNLFARGESTATSRSSWTRDARLSVVLYF